MMRTMSLTSIIKVRLLIQTSKRYHTSNLLNIGETRLKYKKDQILDANGYLNNLIRIECIGIILSWYVLSTIASIYQSSKHSLKVMSVLLSSISLTDSIFSLTSSISWTLYSTSGQHFKICKLEKKFTISRKSRCSIFSQTSS